MTDSQVKITLHYKGAKVGFFCDTPLDTDFPRKAAKGLSREITHKISDLCEQLAKRWHDAEENAGRQIANDPRSCEHRKWRRVSDGRKACADCGAYLD